MSSPLSFSVSIYEKCLSNTTQESVGRLPNVSAACVSSACSCALPTFPGYTNRTEGGAKEVHPIETKTQTPPRQQVAMAIAP